MHVQVTWKIFPVHENLVGASQKENKKIRAENRKVDKESMSNLETKNENIIHGRIVVLVSKH